MRPQLEPLRLFDPDSEGRVDGEREFQRCSLTCVGSADGFTVVGLFAGIGGIELGLGRSGGEAELFCENWEPAQAVLGERFPGVPVVGDVRDLRSLPTVDVVSAGFPCTDLSQAGRMTGIEGSASGLVGEVFRLVRRPRVPVLVLENVRNMLVLDGGRAMRYLVDELERLGYRWAYRLVDSRFTGVPQRRQRVILVAARDLDPRAVLFADDEGEPTDDWYADDLHGFYWTEGLRGLGWARDAIPTLKGGSTVGIPSQPAIWDPAAPLGRRVVLPSVQAADGLQGFPPAWTAAADTASRRKGTRWKLAGNAVTVGVSEWLGSRVRFPGEPLLGFEPLSPGSRWPTAAFGAKGQVWTVPASMWPVRRPYRHLREVVDLAAASPLSARATAGFLDRAHRGRLRFADGFLEDLSEHLGSMTGELSVA